MIERRHFVFGTLAATVVRPSALFASPSPNKVRFGAIRWDAWYDKRGKAVEAQNNLAPTRFRMRAPQHCQFDGQQSAVCKGSQSEMDEEIRLARDSGLSYFAFCYYPKGHPFRSAWELYQSSALKSNVHWCAIISLNALSTAPYSLAGVQKRAAEWASLMAEDHYEKYTDAKGRARPLLFFFPYAEELSTYFDGNWDKVGLAVAELDRQLAKRGLGPVYFVLQKNIGDLNLARQIRASALGHYIVALDRVKQGSYAQLDVQVRRSWQQMAASGQEIVPTAMLAWDPRPRDERPVNKDDALSPSTKSSYNFPTPDEFTAQLRAAREFVESHPAACPSKTVLIYSWSECDEGGCLLGRSERAPKGYFEALARGTRG